METLLTDEQAQKFGHHVYALMNGSEWDSDTFSDIALIAEAIGREFDEVGEG